MASESQIQYSSLILPELEDVEDAEDVEEKPFTNLKTPTGTLADTSVIIAPMITTMISDREIRLTSVSTEKNVSVRTWTH